MHEVGIAQEVLRIIEARAREHGEGRVCACRLRIGELSGVAPESLRFALEVCSRGTRAEGMDVVLEIVAARVKCRECPREWEFTLGQTECPDCGSREVELSGGDDMCVESFQME